jgi:hypothetical protein
MGASETARPAGCALGLPKSCPQPLSPDTYR